MDEQVITMNDLSSQLAALTLPLYARQEAVTGLQYLWLESKKDVPVRENLDRCLEKLRRFAPELLPDARSFVTGILSD